MEINIEHIAEIAKIELKKEEKEYYKNEILKILENFEKIKEVDVEESDYEYISHSKDFFRNEKNTEKFENDLIIKNFPKKEGKKLEVPGLL
jgi:aspartyl/glutamyl-tRNA(Asn/Gln) amidotransferase C subunit